MGLRRRPLDLWVCTRLAPFRLLFDSLVPGLDHGIRIKARGDLGTLRLIVLISWRGKQKSPWWQGGWPLLCATLHQRRLLHDGPAERDGAVPSDRGRGALRVTKLGLFRLSAQKARRSLRLQRRGFVPSCGCPWASQVVLVVKNPPASAGDAWV